MMSTTMADLVLDLTTLTTPPPPVENTTIPMTPIFPDSSKCNYYIVNQTSIEFLKFGNPYGGIPQNLLINAVCWVVLMLMFAILRRAAGNYGRLALIRKDDDESKWTQIFYSQQDDEGGGSSENFEDMNNETDSITTTDYSEVDQGICSWVTTIFTLSDDMILRKCGIDAIQYIRFQRHLIIFVLIITVVCLTVILPINFTMGNVQGDETSFGHTTISNLTGTSNVLWVHIVVGILFMPLGIFIMRKFSVTLRIEFEDNSVSSRTLMLDGIPRDYCKKDYIIRHFQEAYPSFEIDDVQIAYFVAKLCSLNEKLETSQRAIGFCENYSRKNGGKSLTMNPHSCGLLCAICPCCTSSNVDALEFYREQEQSLKQSVDSEKIQLQSKAIGVAFVTFANLSEAKKVNKDHQKIVSCLNSNPPSSSLDNLLKQSSWDVRFAPPPEDIYWENLNRKRHFRVIKVWIINIILFIVLFFFTSPAYIISLLEALPFLNAQDLKKDLNQNLPAYITDFCPTLLLWTLSALLPVLVAYSDWWLGHWRRSVENLWIMRKVFGYLLFMVLILPSIGLTTVRAFVEAVIKKQEDSDKTSLNWQCIFLPDNGAFFINYVATSAFVGTGLEIMRFPELIMYVVRLCFARSKAEISSVRKAILYEFPFGINYGWMLLIFALTVSYSVICPLITPFGLLYMIMKHGVDRYNIYFAYKRSKINKNIHGCAVNCVIISLLLQQLMLLFFNTIRGGLLPPRAIFSITMFTIFCLLFLVQIFFHMFKGMSPIQYMQNSQQPILPEHVENGGIHSRLNRSKQFVPDVLRNIEA
eukprot:GFUD01040453.1.p1 GENE.GFUD01040453.1~~GFUD01040453.1.p1  ORF type:complete len:810 (+),score=66.89 GFUD01040453.1:227-2656(+)